MVRRARRSSGPLDLRSQAILRAVIEEYVTTAAPVGSHALVERHRLGVRSIDAIADFLGDKPYFMGGEPRGVDATMFAFVSVAMCVLFDTPIRDAAANHNNLRRYVSRMTARFYPDLEEVAGCKTAA